MTDLRIADAKTTSGHLPYRGLINALERGFKDGCVVPMRHHHIIDKVAQPDATLLLMPSWSNADDPVQYVGVKLVTVYPGNTARGVPGLNSAYILHCGETGRQLALMDGNVITARRTVATSALAARYLSREDSTKLLVVGAGRVASLIPDAYLAVRPIQEVLVWDIDPENATKLVVALNARGIQATVTKDLANAVRVADIVSAATLATYPLVRGDWLSPGTHLDLIGGFTPKMREADDEAVRRSSVYVDVREALHEAGDLTQPIAKGIIDEDHVLGTLGHLCQRKINGRASNDQITYFKTVGSALADLVAARMVFEQLR